MFLPVIKQLRGREEVILEFRPFFHKNLKSIILIFYLTVLDDTNTKDDLQNFHKAMFDWSSLYWVKCISYIVFLKVPSRVNTLFKINWIRLRLISFCFLNSGYVRLYWIMGSPAGLGLKHPHRLGIDENFLSPFILIFHK